MIDEKCFKQAKEDGVCFIKNTVNESEKWLIVDMSKDNKRVSVFGDILTICLGDEK